MNKLLNLPRITSGKVFLTMKFTIIFLLAGICNAFAAGYAQSEKVTIKVNNATFKEVISAIEKQTDYVFFYKTNDVDNNQHFNLDVKDKAVNEILDLLTKKSSLSYYLSNNYIFFDKRKVKETEFLLQNQGKTVTGTIVDAKGEPIIGATVVVKNNPSQGTITDIDGNFTLLNLSDQAVLLITYVGMKPQEVSTIGRTAVDIVMEADIELLDEVVVVGYGSMKKSNLTGSISSIKSDDLPKVANASVSNMLAGKAAGVMVKQQSSQPGGGIEIVVRGSGSVNAGNEPLYVVDGFPVNNNTVEPRSNSRYNYGNRNPLSSLNPNDIESIEILKDASSTAIYGARAANGVVLITTKRGKEGKASVEFSANYSTQNISKYFDMLNAKEFMIQANRIGRDAYLIDSAIGPYGPNKQDNPDKPYVPAYTTDQIAKAGTGSDWWNEVTRTGRINEYNLSISGGTEKTRALVSMNYFNQKGVVVNSEFKRMTARVNLDQKIFNNLKVGVSLNASYIDNGNVQLGERQWENSGVLIAALQMDPTVPIYDSEGNYSMNSKYTPLPNPVSYKEIQDNTISKRILANTFVEWEIIQGLKAKSSFGIDDKSGLRSNYLPKTFLYGANDGGRAYKGLSASTDYLFNTTLNYVKSLNEVHNFDVLVGYEYQLFRGENLGSGNTKYFTDLFGSDNLGAGEGTPTVTSGRTEQKLASYFGRLQYNYMEKYLASLTLRRDGTSNFGKNNKWGVFPSMSFGWRITEEDFMKPYEAISNLKLRLSYGQTGNSGIGDKAFIYYGPQGNYLFGNAPQTAVGLTQNGNPNLKWETTTEFNVGLDFGFLRNRISGSFDYFNKTVDDLLAFRELPTYSPVRVIADNVGSTQLSGVELYINTVNIDKAFRWTTDFNISAYKDQWKTRNSDVILDPWVGANNPIRAIYGYKTNGIVQIGQKVAHMPNALPGNLIYQDINGFDDKHQLTGKPDGKIDQADQVLLGSPDPGFMFGFGNTIEYKGFDLNIFFYGMGNRTLMNQSFTKYLYDARRLAREGHNQITKVSEIFTADQPSSTLPGIARHPNGGYNNDFMLEKADFIRLKNITLGYNIPRKVFNNALDVRVFADAQNLFTITKYSGVDPESDSLGAYPNQKSFSIGLNVKF